VVSGRAGVRGVLAAVFGRSEAPPGWYEAAQAEHDAETRAAEQALLAAAGDEEVAARIRYNVGAEPANETEAAWFEYFDGFPALTSDEAWESGPDAAKWFPEFADAAEARAPEQAARAAEYQVHLAEMAGARAWLAEHPEVEHEDPEAAYVAGRDPRDAAEALQFAEWDAQAQAEADAAGWAGAGFTRPGPEEPEEAMTPEEEADAYVGGLEAAELAARMDREAEAGGPEMEGI
jgi:hypothetical protein